MAGDTNPVTGPSATNSDKYYCGHCGYYFPTYQSLHAHCQQIYSSSNNANQNAARSKNVVNNVQKESRKEIPNPNIHEKAKTLYQTNTDKNVYPQVPEVDISLKKPIAKNRLPELQGYSVKHKYYGVNQKGIDPKQKETVELSPKKEHYPISMLNNSVQYYRDVTSAKYLNSGNGSPNYMTLNKYGGSENTRQLDRVIERQNNESTTQNVQQNAELQSNTTTFLLCKICKQYFNNIEEALAHSRDKHPNSSNCLLEAQVPKSVVNSRHPPHDARDSNNMSRKNLRCLACHEICALSETSNHQMSKHPGLNHCILFENYDAETTQHGNQHIDSIQTNKQNANNQKNQDNLQFKSKITEINNFVREQTKLQANKRKKEEKSKLADTSCCEESDDSVEELLKTKKKRKHRKDGEKVVNRQNNQKWGRDLSDSGSTESTCESSDDTSKFRKQKRKQEFNRESNEDRNKETLKSKGDYGTSEESSDSNSLRNSKLKRLLNMGKRVDLKKQLKSLLLDIKNKKAKKRPEKYKLYKCICDLHFLSEEKLFEHIKKGDHNVKCKSCKICERKFTKKILKTHIKIHHKNMKLGKKDFIIVTVDSLDFSDTDSDSDSGEKSSKSKHKNKESNDVSEETNVFETQDKLKNLSEKELPCKPFDLQNKLEPTATEPNKKKKPIVNLFKCVVCDVHFLNESTFKTHLQKRAHTVRTRTQCTTCGLYFTQKSLFKHEDYHHTKLKLSLEDFQITHSESISENYANLDGNGGKTQVNLYKCEPCDIHFLHETTWKQHLQENIHCMSTKTQCSTCFLFFSKKSLTKHIQWHHDKKNLSVTDFNILNSSDFPHYSVEQESTETLWKENPHKKYDKLDLGTRQNATKKRSKNRLYKCDVCNVCFLCEKALMQHLRRNPEHVFRTKIKCKYCQLNFFYRSMHNHVDLHHKQNKFKKNDFEIINSSGLSKKNFKSYKSYSRPSKDTTNVSNCPSKDNNDISNSLRDLEIFHKDNTNLDHTSYSNFLYRCSDCHLCFLTKKTLESHLYINDHCIKKTLECHMCQHKFTVNSLPRHLQVQHKALKLRCEDFEIITLNIESAGILKTRSKSMTGSTNNKNLRSKGNFLPNKEGKTLIPQDNLMFITNYLYRCTICNICFLLKKALVLHMNVGIHNKYTKMVTCRTCKYTFSLSTFSQHDMIQHQKLGLKREDFLIVDNKQNQKSNKALIKKCSVQLTTLQSSLITTTIKSYQQGEEEYCSEKSLSQSNLRNSNIFEENKESTRDSVIVCSTQTPDYIIETSDIKSSSDIVDSKCLELSVNNTKTGTRATNDYSHLLEVKKEPDDSEYNSIVKEDIDNEEKLFALDKPSNTENLSNQIALIEPLAEEPWVKNLITNLLSKSNSIDYCATPEEGPNNNSLNYKLNMLNENSLYSLFHRLKERPNDKEIYKKLKSLICDDESKLNEGILKEKLKLFLMQIGNINSDSTGKDKSTENQVTLKNDAKLYDSDECENKKSSYQNTEERGGATNRNCNVEKSDTLFQKSTTEALLGFVHETNKQNEPVTTMGNNPKDFAASKTTNGNNINNDIINSSTDLDDKICVAVRAEIEQSSILCETNTNNGEKKPPKDKEKHVKINEVTSGSGPDISSSITVISTDIESELLEDENVNATKQSSGIYNNSSTTTYTTIDNNTETTLDISIANINKKNNTAVFAVENSKLPGKIEDVIKSEIDGLFFFEDPRTDVSKTNDNNVFENIQVTDVKSTSFVFNATTPIKVKKEVVDIDSHNQLRFEFPDYVNVTSSVIEISTDEE